ncbi:MAG TPA: acylphosphatase [Candidatus Eisenbacteria bacterium]|nr:acylphosphatase [Candidatus Eisenbacteria bacterium]
MRKHLAIRVTGRVQGVFFRASAKAEAERLGIAGFAKNADDGAVQIEAEGESDSLDRFVAWCGRGPDFAQVDAVDVHEGEPRHFTSFTIE